MEDNNKFVKYIAIIALLIAVVGVSVGFAAFTNTVNIKAKAEVTPGDGSSYAGGQLSTDDDTTTPGTVTPTTEGGATGDPATLTNDTIDNIKAKFTAPGQSVTYTFYGRNDSAFVSYLNSVVFGSKSCAPASAARDGVEPATASLVTAACNGITMSIKAGSETFTATNTSVTGHTLASGANETITVTITYATGAATADGAFDVDFGTSVLTYSTVD